MKDIKELTVPQEIYIEEFDIKVRPFLTYAEIEAIGEEMLACPNELLQNLSLMLNVLKCCTDIPKEYITMINEDKTNNEQFLGFDLIVLSGLWGAVEKCMYKSTSQVWDYVYDLENKDRAIARFVNQTLPEYLDKALEIFEGWEKKLPKGKQWNELISNLPNQLKEALNVMKDDGNAEIIQGAMAMNKVKGE